MSDFQGKAREIAGKVQEKVGQFTGDARTQAEGLLQPSRRPGRATDRPPQRRDQGPAHPRDTHRSCGRFSAGTPHQVTSTGMTMCRS